MSVVAERYGWKPGELHLRSLLAASPEAALELHRTRARDRAFGRFIEAEHPRHPAGTSEGGEFAPKGAVVDWSAARSEFDKWSAEMAPYYAESEGYPPGYWGRERLKVWEQYQSAVNTQLPALQARLNGAQVPGLVIKPELNSATGGDLDVILDPEALPDYGPDFQVELPAARDGLSPSFSVWTYPEGANKRHANDPSWHQVPEGTQVEDVLDITDIDFFPDGPDSDLAGDYARAVDAARGLPDEPGYVTVYRGMSDAERDAWDKGDEIPLGKFFAGIPTAQYAQDISGELPQLYSFRVPRSMLMQTGEHEYQLKKRGRMKDGVIEAALPVQASGLPSHWQAVLDALHAAAFMEAQHPRHPAGTKEGGEFAPLTIAEMQAELQRRKEQPHVEPEYDAALGGMWSPDDAEYIFDPDDPYYTSPIWKAIKLPDGQWKFWITNKMGAPHHQQVLSRLAKNHNQAAFYSGDALATAKDQAGQTLNPELQAVVTRNAGRWRDAAERASSSLAAAAVNYDGNGGMIALYPQPDEAEAIARVNGQPPEDLHVTLLYFEDGVPENAAAALDDLGFEGLKGQISGIARFQEGEDGVPVVGLVSAVGLNELRAELADRLPGYSERHGFVPHLTLGYDQGEDPLVEDPEGAVGLPVTFSAVKVKNKDGEPQDVLTAAGWDETAHPRWPAGSERGGEFAPKDAMVVSEARVGLQKDGKYRISKAPNLREWLRVGLEHGYNSDVLDDWPNLNSEQARQLRRWLQDPHLDRALAGRGLGKERQELAWVRRDLGEEYPIETVAPDPPALKTAGKVGSIMDKVTIGGGRLAGNMLEGVRTVDRTLSYPTVPGEPKKIHLKGVGAAGRDAAFWRKRATMQPSHITVNSNAVDPTSSTVHELGHYLDSLLGQDRWASDPAFAKSGREYWDDYSSEQGPGGTLHPVLEAVKGTEMYRKLEAASGARWDANAFTYGGRRFAPGWAHIRYLLNPPEVVARSFEQYIASKNPGSKLSSTVRHAFSRSEELGSPDYPGYMKGQDLENVNKVWDQVLDQRGLLKKKGFAEVPEGTFTPPMTPAQRALENRRRKVMGLEPIPA